MTATNVINVIFDTSILIDQLRGVEKANKLIIGVESGRVKGHISAITEAELLSGEECKKSSQLGKVVKLVTLFTKIDVNNEISKKAGEFRRKYSVPLIDSIIAATAYIQGCKIWTKNKKDFEKIKEIDTEEPY